MLQLVNLLLQSEPKSSKEEINLHFIFFMYFILPLLIFCYVDL